ncbi:hypothetical protein Daura_47720 [Dactylosporangium aurantiacum]|uniref:Uncharacterized protein n=1 Tax=Dactylosporangium aurantiacum TaxID=35754 RepID=A0A9Q9MIW9_9ACTN|nr:hypothetical protein [Dactylosporangium aurantiacum]MDG6105368.1 hypothetical protein [Dactylosporangium aurantiacum]UWZ54086.1 hypothetical protein Daura_47720 [Dactylosporangium aurantiacum]
MARLPGGLPAWRGRRLLRGAGPARAGGPGPATVSAARHAALHSLVIEAAKYADAPPPAAVALTGAGTVQYTGGVLRVGLPLVWGLPADHLRIVLAHELALPDTRHVDLVRGLLAARTAADAGPPGTAREAAGAKLLAATEPLHVTVEQVRDAAAIAAGGGGLSGVEDAAAALLRAATIDTAFAAFAEAEGRHLITATGDGDGAGPGGGTVPVRIADLHAGWRLRLARWGAPAVHGDALLDEVPRRHPGLAAELRALGGVPKPGLAADAVSLDDLTAEEEQALAAEVIAGDGAWTRFGELPTEVYAHEVERQAREYVEAVRTVLGRDPDDRDELAGTLLRRPVDVERARRGEPAGGGEDQPPPPWMGVVLLSVLVEYTLLRKDWRREHPLVARRLVAPDGEVLDLNGLYQRPDELRRLLAGGPTD